MESVNINFLKITGLSASCSAAGRSVFRPGVNLVFSPPGAEFRKNSAEVRAAFGVQRQVSTPTLGPPPPRPVSNAGERPGRRMNNQSYGERRALPASVARTNQLGLAAARAAFRFRRRMRRMMT
jgi:hypothetical protein